MKLSSRRFFDGVPRTMVLLGVVLLIVAVLAQLPSMDNFRSQPPMESTDQRDNARVVQDTRTEREIARLEERARALGSHAVTYAELGNAYLQRARETGDAAFYSRAERVFQRALELEPNNVFALTSMGALALSKHEFVEAKMWAARALALAPNSPTAHGVMGDAQIELGEYDGAVRSIQTMVDLKPASDSYARVSYLRELMGDTEGAIAAMAKAATSSAPAGENAAWLRVMLGNLHFGTGNVEAAKEQYQSALTAFPGYYLALAGLGNVEAASGDTAAAIKSYARAVDAVPQPSLLATLGDLYVANGQPEQAEQQFATIDFIAEMNAVDGAVYDRQIALFYADHDRRLGEALDLTVRELDVRKDIYGYDAFAWAAYKNGLTLEAVDAIDQALRLNTQDASLYYHAGLIYRAAGDPAQAREYLEAALRLNPHFSVLQPDHAREVLQEMANE